MTDNSETMKALPNGKNFLAKRKTGNIAEVIATELMNLIAVKTSVILWKKYAGEIKTE